MKDEEKEEKMSNAENFIKKCRVCNGKALCYNFQGLSCGPCRLFFYRNSAKYDKFKCKQNEYCNIDSTTSKYCKKCRLKKCYEIGMDLSLTVKKTKKSILSKSESYLENILVTHMDYNETSSTLVKLIKSSPKSPFSLKLNSYEAQLIAKVETIMGRIFPDETKLPVIGLITHPAETANKSTYYIPKIIKLCNSNAVFAELPEAKKLLVLKPFVFEFMTTRITFIWNEELEVVPMIANESFTEVMHVKMGIYGNMETKNLLNANHHWKLKYRQDMENDATIRDLLIMQLLFKPRPELLVAEIFCYQYTVYCYLLKRYLEDKYGDEKKAERKYGQLMVSLEKMDEGKERFTRVLEEIGVSMLPDLTVELFDLKV